MYNLSPRDPVIHSSTKSFITPNTYIICSSFQSHKKNKVPFLSTTERSFVASKLNDNFYDFPRPSVKGGSSILNRASRFSQKYAWQTPGPGQYRPKRIQAPKKITLDPNKPKLYICKVPYSVSITAPSIPSKIDENGYTIDCEENIVKNPPKMPRPVYFRKIPGQFDRKELYKGCEWSKRLSKRFSMLEEDSPGPADYDSKIPKCISYDIDDEYREMARRFTFIPRYIEERELKTTREGLPGPGDYDIGEKTDRKFKSASIHPRPFISGSARFFKELQANPGPGQYEDVWSRKKRSPSLRNVPFRIDAQRFSSKKIITSPGPAAYSLKDPIGRDKNPYRLIHAPFAKMEMRKAASKLHAESTTPSPATYTPRMQRAGENCSCENKEIYSSVFMSAKERFSNDQNSVLLSSAKYNVAQAYDAAHSKRSYRIRTYQGDATAPRVCKQLEAADRRPGPALYTPKLVVRANNGYTFNKVMPRFEKEIQETPPPDQYYIHPKFEESVFGAFDTHNQRLKESVLRKSPDSSQIKRGDSRRDSQSEWFNMLTAKKQLKCFYREPNTTSEQLKKERLDIINSDI